MAVVTVKSTSITNRDATPRILNNARISRGAEQHIREIVAIANGDSATSKYLVATLPSNAVVGSVRVSAPDIGTTTTFDVGLYRATADGGAVVDADFFKAAHIVNAGATSKSEVSMSNIITTANATQPLWQLLGLTSDPSVFYDLVLTLVGAADGAGSVLVEADYTQ